MNGGGLGLLERHFNTAFDAPDGVKKLRELILTLAMRGELVPQDPGDQPASELLREIEAEKARLVAEGKIKRKKGSREGAKTRSGIGAEDVPYALPVGWEWVRLADLIELVSGQHLKPNEYNEAKVGFSYYTGPADFGPESPVASRWTTVDRAMAIQGDILLTVKGAGVGKINVLAEERAAISRQLMALRVVGVNRDFVLRFLATIFFELQALAVGIAIPGIGREDVLLRRFPLPPLPEQHRIVAKIDQLMARCDELEKLRSERDQKRLTVHTDAIHRLLEAPARESFTGAWQFITRNFPELYSVKENVKELRKTILQLAVMGKLVPQDPKDPPASELLKEIEAEKARLVKEGKIKKPKALPPIKPGEVPYEVPAGWEWVHFEEIVEIGSGVTKGRKLAGRTLVSLPYLRVANVQRGYLNLGEIKEIEIPSDEVEKFRLMNRDLLITEGGDWDKVGRTCIWRAEISLCLHQNHIFKARKVLENQNEVWLEKYLNSPIARAYFAGASKQTTNLASINKTQLRGCPVPVPSPPEQHRIVAKIKQLMTLCDGLEQQIEGASGKQNVLLSAVMAQVQG